MSTSVTTIPHSRPFLSREEIDAVTRVIESRHIAQGREVAQLESEWAAATGTRGAVCVGSGLAALRLALHAVGVKSGSEVIVPAYSCIALLNAVLALGATPVLADVGIDRWTLDPSSAARLVTPKTAAVIAVHLFGAPASMRALRELAIPVIEDCAHGIGGRADGQRFGGAGTASIASFYATKMIAGGEGGIVASDDDSLLRLIGTARNPSDQRPNALYLNDKLTDIEAAIVRVQLSRLSWTLQQRKERAHRYREMLAPLAKRSVLVLPDDTDGRIWYRFAVRLTGHDARSIAVKLQAQGIEADQPVWDLRGVVEWNRELPASDVAFDRVLSLPLYADLSADQQERVCEALELVLS